MKGRLRPEANDALLRTTDVCLCLISDSSQLCATDRPSGVVNLTISTATKSGYFLNSCSTALLKRRISFSLSHIQATCSLPELTHLPTVALIESICSWMLVSAATFSGSVTSTPSSDKATPAISPTNRIGILRISVPSRIRTAQTGRVPNIALLLTNRQCRLWVAVSMGRRNTRTKPRHSGFGPEGLTRLSKVLERQLIPVNELVARKIGLRREPLSEQAIRVVLGTRLPLFPRIGTRRPCESLATTLIQRIFARQWLSDKVLRRPVEIAVISCPSQR